MATKQNLVVIGNGMSGARTVEEILARGGAELFNIAMFGDEPQGNYNRILLSDVLEGSHQPQDILLNPLSWYSKNGIRLHAGVRANRIYRVARHAIGADGSDEPYDKLGIATGSRPFIPPLDGVTSADGRLKPGVFGFRSLEEVDIWQIMRLVKNALPFSAAACSGSNALMDSKLTAWKSTSCIDRLS